MANKEKHLEQYYRNRKLLDENCFDVNNSKFLDWVVTITFYAAVHLIEMHLADIPYHSGSHKTRNSQISILDKFKLIQEDYYTLYMQSRKARYECGKFSTKKATEVLELLYNIEEHLKAA